MKNKKWSLVLIFVGIYFLIYLTATIFKNQLLGDLLSPIGGIMAGSIIINSYINAEPTFLLKKILLFLIMACFFWVSADILWAIYELGIKLNPNDSKVIQLLYFGTNICLFFAMISYIGEKIRTWNGLQLVVDSIAITISSLYLMWILLVDKGSNIPAVMNSLGWITVITLVFDILVFICITIWCYSIREGKIPFSLRVSILSIFAFFLTDITWVWLEIQKIYIPNSLIDAAYMSTLLGVALSISYYTRTQKSIRDIQYSNVSMQYSFKMNWFILLAAPLTIVLAKGFIFKEILMFILIFMVYESITFYIQGAFRNKRLLKKELEINTELERRIAMRTKELEEKNKQLNYLSNQDIITNLYNRRYFMKALKKKISEVKAAETIMLLFIDVDRFKTINDTYGHDVGDKVIQELSKRLEMHTQEKSILARFGGDEFVYAVHSESGYQEAEQIAQQLLNTCKKVIDIGYYSFYITLSIGISIYPLDAKDINMQLKNADIAMYQAKRMGYSRYISFNQELSDMVKRKNEIEMLLKQAVYNQEFSLLYQPQFETKGQELIGIEALIRWNNPHKGMIFPDEFIPISEETDDIIAIGNWVMETALQQISTWNTMYGMHLKMGINVSPKQLEQADFIHGLQLYMDEKHINPNWVDVEITEGVAMQGKRKMIAIAQQFQSIGVSVSIDDFGTGYSSLSYLKMFPFDKIKIAKQLIDAIEHDRYDMNIVKFTILLAKSIGVKTIAEGVETKEQLEILTRLGCEQIQGFYLGKPVSAREFEQRFLRNINKNTLIL